MLIRYFLLLLLTCPFTAPLAGQCATLAEIRGALADSLLAPAAYARELHQRCPTAADSLSQAFYARSLFFNGLDERQRAIEFGELALTELNQIDTSLQLGKMNYNLGLFNFWEGDFRESLHYMRTAAAIFPRVDHPQSERRWLQSLEDIGMLYTELGDYDRGEETFRKIIREAEARGRSGRSAQVRRRLGELYEKTGQLGAAAGALDVAVAGSEDPYLRAIARVSRVSLNHERGAMDAARTEFRDLLRQPDDLDDFNLARLYSLGILLATDAADYALAEEYFAQNLVVARRDGTAPVVAAAWDNGGEIALARGDFDLARTRFSRAVETLTAGFRATAETLVPTTEQLAESDHKVYLFVYLGDLARALEASGRPAEALTALRSADEVVDQLRAGLGGEVSSLFWREEVLPVYEQAIRTSIDAGIATTESFYFFEKSRAILLLEAITANDLRGTLPRSAARRLSAAERRLSAARRSRPADPAAAGAELAVARQQLLDVRAALAATFPSAFPDANPDILDREAAAAQLARAGYGAQLQYFVGEKHTYLQTLFLDGSGSVLNLGPTDSVLAVVRPLLGYFTAAGAIDQDPAGYDRAASLAFTTLLAPASAPANVPLLIIPDGLLSYVPFAALRTDGRYLIERNPVSYAQSATLFGRSAGEPAANALAFTPFAAPTDQPLPHLPFTNDEAAALRAHYPATHLSAGAATRAALLDSLPYGILHLGTHARANRTADAAPLIHTATEPLLLPDIYGMRLNGALVTLSACNSNVGPLARGEGVLGLGRAFRAAGAGGVVASLWSLNDRATADITARFYADLAAGQTKPRALHNAQLAYLGRTDLPAYLKSPYYWAGLTYYGAPTTLKPQSDATVWWLAGAAGLLLLLAGLLWRFRR